ncbi:hypothetical protein RsTz2092_09630 [Deferribacterales bacterium RsTz2092]
MYELVISEPAEQDLDSIVLYISTKFFNPQAATSLAEHPVNVPCLPKSKGLSQSRC